MAVPGIEFFTWPDQWYHADKDLPENGDPTEMRRVAFIGAATGWASVNLTDDMLPGLLSAVAGFGQTRVAERGISRARSVMLEEGTDGLAKALNILRSSVAREMDAVASVREIYTGSVAAKDLVRMEEEGWKVFESAMEDYLTVGFTGGEQRLPIPSLTAEEEAMDRRVPRLAEGIRGQVFSLGRFDRMQAYNQEHPESVSELGLSRAQTTQILNFVNGDRSILTIRDRVEAWTGESLSLETLNRYLGILEEVGWLEIGDR